MVVFFDILYRDGESLLHLGYEKRRAILEQTISIQSGYSILAERCPIALDSLALDELHDVFAAHIADHQEGVVLKAANATYNDVSLPWVKVSLNENHVRCEA